MLLFSREHFTFEDILSEDRPLTLSIGMVNERSRAIKGTSLWEHL